MRIRGMKRFLLSTALLSALSLGACGGSDPAPASGNPAEQAGVVRSTLSDAGQAAQRFGQAHLGHFLKLEAKDLRREGFDAPSDISIRVETDHTSYCIRATSSELPSINPWAKATLSSDDRVPDPEDRCSL